MGCPKRDIHRKGVLDNLKSYLIFDMQHPPPYKCTHTYSVMWPFRDRLRPNTVVFVWGIRQFYYLRTYCAPHYFVYYVVTASCKFSITCKLLKHHFNVFCLETKKNHTVSFKMIQITFFFTYVRRLIGSKLHFLRVKFFFHSLLFRKSNKKTPVRYILFKYVIKICYLNLFRPVTVVEHEQKPLFNKDLRMSCWKHVLCISIRS